MQKNEHKQLANFLQNGEYQSALDLLAAIEERAKDDSDYWYYHAHIARKMGDLKRAEIFCRKALELSPVSRDANFEMGIIYKKAGDKANALKYYNLALETLAQDTYDHIKGQPIREIEAKYPGDNLEGWMRLAFQIAAKNVAKDGIESAMIPTGATAKKILEENPYMGVSIY